MTVKVENIFLQDVRNEMELCIMIPERENKKFYWEGKKIVKYNFTNNNYLDIKERFQFNVVYI